MANSGEEFQTKCRPWNYHDFLSRLQSFHKTQNWFAKPKELSAVRASLHGWNNTGYNQLHCYVCKTDWKHEEGNVDLQTTNNCLEIAHAETCEWRRTSCPQSFINIPHFDDSMKLFDDFDQRLQAALKVLLSNSVFPSIPEDTKLGGEDEKQPTVEHLSILLSTVQTHSSHQRSSIWTELGINFGADAEMVLRREDTRDSLLQSFVGDLSIANLLAHKRPFVERLLQHCDVSKSVVIRAAFILALFGWKVELDGKLTCKLCCRDVSLQDSMQKNKAIDVIGSHRHFCPWISEQLHCDELHTQGAAFPLGYELCQHTVLANIGSQLRKQYCANAPASKTKNSDIDDESTKELQSAERAYKRIKLMLSAAASPAQENTTL